MALEVGIVLVDEASHENKNQKPCEDALYCNLIAALSDESRCQSLGPIACILLHSDRAGDSTGWR